MQIWRITSKQATKVVAIPDLGVYLQPGQSIEVPADRAAWSRDLQDVLKQEVVEKQILDPVRQIAPVALPSPAMRVKPSMPTLNAPKPEQALPAAATTDETNRLLKEILTVLKERPVVVQAVAAGDAALSFDSARPTSSPQEVFIPHIQREQVEIGGDVVTESKVSDSDKAKKARDKLKQMKNGG